VRLRRCGGEVAVSPASAGESAAPLGSCRKPRGALYVEVGRGRACCSAVPPAPGPLRGRLPRPAPPEPASDRERDDRRRGRTGSTAGAWVRARPGADSAPGCQEVLSDPARGSGVEDRRSGVPAPLVDIMCIIGATSRCTDGAPGGRPVGRQQQPARLVGTCVARADGAVGDASPTCTRSTESPVCRRCRSHSRRGGRFGPRPPSGARPGPHRRSRPFAVDGHHLRPRPRPRTSPDRARAAIGPPRRTSIVPTPPPESPPHHRHYVTVTL
jgi:hypothetical protein